MVLSPRHRVQGSLWGSTKARGPQGATKEVPTWGCGCPCWVWDPQPGPGGQSLFPTQPRPFTGRFAWACPKLMEYMLESRNAGKEALSHTPWEAGSGRRNRLGDRGLGRKRGWWAAASQPPPRSHSCGGFGPAARALKRPARERCCRTEAILARNAVTRSLKESSKED